MRIGFVTSSLSSVDGWGRYSRSLIEAVSRHADTVALTQRDLPVQTSLPHVHSVLPRASFHPFVQAQAFAMALRHLRGCDVIHSLIEPFAPGTAAASLFLGSRFAMTLHGTYAVPPAGALSFHRFLLRMAYSRACMTTTGSKQTETKVRERIGFGECRFIPNGVDPKEFQFLSLPREDFLLTTGGVKPRKGADVVIRALGILRDTFPALRYKVVGDLSNKSYLSSLEQLASELGVRDRVEFLGVIPDAELLSLYNRCHAFVLAARNADGQFEGFPMVYFEANACGAPVVTTTGFGSEYAIRSGKNGFLVPPEDPKALADALARVVGDQGVFQALQSGALEVAREHSWANIAERQLMPMYRDMLR